ELVEVAGKTRAFRAVATGPLPISHEVSSTAASPVFAGFGAEIVPLSALEPPSPPARATAARPAVPRDFGAPRGTPISNLSTILGDPWRALGHDRSPSIAFIFVEPMAKLKVRGDSGSGTNPFGHAAVAYTIDGETKVMNIVGAS